MHVIEFRRSAADELEGVPRREQENIRNRIKRLAEMPRPAWARRLAGQRRHWRFRVGAYRVIYEIDDRARRVIIARIGSRG